MMPNAPSCFEWRLYVIVDAETIGSRNPLEVAAAAIKGGADVLQLRNTCGSTRAWLETAQRLLPLTRQAHVPLIINDRADVAHAIGADGVHLGQEDLPIAAARTLLGPGRLIGKSTHSLAQAIAACAEGADYIGFGPIFPTPTKPTYGSVGLRAIREVVASAGRPVVCIGGIDQHTLEEVLRAGAQCVAVVRAVCAVSDPEVAARELKRQLTQSHRASLGASL